MKKDIFLFVQNFGYLSLLQVFTIFLPLMIYPYLVKTLGTEIYGLVLFAQAIGTFFAVLIDLGFNISATKEVSVCRDDKEKLSEIVSVILTIKGLVFVVCFILFGLLVLLIPKFASEKSLYFLSFLICLNELLFPQWFFLGIEKMKYISLINTFIRTSFFLLILLFVKNQSDYLLVPLCNLLGVIIGGLISLFIIYKKWGIRYRVPIKERILEQMNNTSQLFIFNIFGTIKSKSNELFLGTITSFEAVVFYNLPNRIVSVIIGIFSNISSTLYPRFSLTRDNKNGRKVVLSIFFLSLMAYLAIGCFAEQLILLLGGQKMLSSVVILYILGSFIPIHATSTALGQMLLLPNNYKREYLSGTVVSTMIYLASSMCLVVTQNLNIYSVSYLLLMSNLLSLFTRIYYCWKRGLMR